MDQTLPASDPALIERLARALCRNNDADPDALDAAGQPRWHWYERDVRAVLEVLAETGRVIVPAEPDAAMLAAGRPAVAAVVPSILRLPADWPEGEAAVRACWQAMLRAGSR